MKISWLLCWCWADSIKRRWMLNVKFIQHHSSFQSFLSIQLISCSSPPTYIYIKCFTLKVLSETRKRKTFYFHVWGVQKRAGYFVLEAKYHIKEQGDKDSRFYHSIISLLAIVSLHHHHFFPSRPSAHFKITQFASPPPTPNPSPHFYSFLKSLLSWVNSKSWIFE